MVAEFPLVTPICHLIILVHHLSLLAPGNFLLISRCVRSLSANLVTSRRWESFALQSAGLPSPVSLWVRYLCRHQRRHLSVHYRYQLRAPHNVNLHSGLIHLNFRLTWRREAIDYLSPSWCPAKAWAEMNSTECILIQVLCLVFLGRRT